MFKRTKQIFYRILGLEGLLTISGLYHLHRQNYEPGFQEFLSLIPINGVLLDVGANIGVTCVLARRQRPDIDLVAFEPLRSNLRVLRILRLIYSVRNIQVFPVAIGEAERTVAITIPRVDGVPSTGLSHVSPVDSATDEATYKVLMRNLDSFSFNQVDAIKIDVESYEFNVLLGAQRLIEKHRPLIYCEIMCEDRFNEITAFMSSLGYSCVRKDAVDFLFLPN
jgi:FkbM family methyltransferase